MRAQRKTELHRKKKSIKFRGRKKMAMIYLVFYLSLSGLAKICDLPLCKAATHHPQLDAQCTHTHTNEYNESLQFTKSRARHR